MPKHYDQWNFAEVPEKNIRKIESETGLTSLVSEILYHRLHEESDTASEWIAPRLDQILDPHELLSCKEAAERLVTAIDKGEKVAIFSDYDVDGISSSALLTRVMKSFGCEPESFIPDRMEEGYGLSQTALERCFSKSIPDLLVVLDCGTSSDREIQWIAEKGTFIIIIDHHSRNDPPVLPDRCFLINPHLPDQTQPTFHNHCTVGLVFKFVHALLRSWEDRFGGARDRVNLKELLDLVALGTIADLVPLRGENRIFAHHGLQRLAKTTNHGLRALLQVADVDTDAPLKSSDVGFRLGPRINAGGRIETGTLALDLLLTDDNRLAFDLARKLDAINRQRRTLEQTVADEAKAQIGDTPPMGVVAWGRDWHPGVVGIVAGRLARTLHRPTIVLGWDGSIYKGSGRGIPGIDLLEVMRRCPVQPEKWGGHPAAMGLSISESILPAFAEAFARAVTEACGGEAPASELRIDATTAAEDLSRQQILEIEALGPFGMANAEPIVAIPGVQLEEPPRTMGRNHIRFALPGASGISVIGWRMAEEPPPVGSEIDLAVRLSRSWWRGRESIRGELVDWRPSESGKRG